MASSRLTLLLAAAASAASALDVTGAAVQHAVTPRDIVVEGLAQRATDQAPKGYTPASVDCPSDRPEIRNGSSLSDQEREWLLTRRNETITPIRELLDRLSIPDFNSTKYLADVDDDASALPNIAIAVSGGGYRAMLNGAGAIAAFDSRSDGSTDKGNLGGLLQSATYLAGLSGGGWLVGSLYTNNFTSVQASVNSDVIWQLGNSIFEGPEQYSLLGYYDELFDSISDKDDAGFQRSLTDYWGRALSYQLVNASDGGPGFTFSSIAEDETFSKGKAPMPFLVSDGRAPGETIISINTTVFDFNPWELGSSDPTIRGYVPLKYVGSNFRNGTLAKDEDCISGFDNVGFVMGTSSSLFNQIILYLQDDNNQYVPDDVPDFVIDALSSILTTLGTNDDDIADWTPNPFRGWNPDENPGADSERLTLVDGGEDLQNIPYHPLILNERAVDVIFSVDSSADTESSWPDGQSPMATYDRSLHNISEGTSFPVVPGRNSFINLGLNTHPTFFGCNASNTSEPSPLIVYIPNYPYLYPSNISTFQMTVNDSERDAIVQNGYAVATQLNATRDKNWPVCVGCAILSRSFDRTNATVPDACQSCFETYCWNGTIDESDPPAYYPDLYSEEIDVQDVGARVAQSGMAIVLAGLAAAVVML